MKIIRLQLKRFLFVVILVSLMVTAHFFWQRQEKFSSCLLPPEALKKVEQLLDLLQKPLKTLNITYFLCYNSLWGALKVKGPLPWQNSMELCVLNSEILAIHDSLLYDVFKKYKLSVSYNPAGGFYTVTMQGESFPSATLTIFEKDLVTGQMRRNGWIHRMLPPNSCDELNCFPPELIDKPLPLGKFGPYSVPVPREGIEIQKYLFPSSWWKEVGPENCLEAVQ